MGIIIQDVAEDDKEDTDDRNHLGDTENESRAEGQRLVEEIMADDKSFPSPVKRTKK